MFSSKQQLKSLVAKSRTELALQSIVAATKPLADQYLYNQAVALSGRWTTNERLQHLGTLTTADYHLEKEKINTAVLALIDEFPERLVWLKWVLIALASVLIALVLFRVFGQPESLQLTVYVQDTSGKSIPALQNKGKVMVDFGNDRRAPLIGENGRTNLGEIPEKFQGETIPIVLEGEGYEPVEPNKKYVLDGNPVYLIVRRDQSLGLIHGRVATRDGSTFIAGALVIIAAEGRDTTSVTDSLGYFRLVLPEKMQKTEYQLTVKKEGFQVVRERFLPKTTGADIRLEK